MAQPFQVEIREQRRTSRHHSLELRILQGPQESFDAVANLFPDQLILNLPANSAADAFVDWLSSTLGRPAGAPVIKCSAPWNTTMVGAMQTVSWQLTEALHDLFLARLR